MNPKTNTCTISILGDLPQESFQNIFQKQDLKVIDSDFQFNVKDLAIEIEALRSQTDLGYIECTVEICERYNLEIESMKKSLPKIIKEKIELEASELNLLKYKVNSLL